MTHHSLFPFQAFVSDPDGYYIEFCNCSHMEEALNPVKFKDQEWSLFKSLCAARVWKCLLNVQMDSLKWIYGWSIHLCWMNLSNGNIFRQATSWKRRRASPGWRLSAGTWVVRDPPRRTVTLAWRMTPSRVRPIPLRCLPIYSNLKFKESLHVNLHFEHLNWILSHVLAWELEEEDEKVRRHPPERQGRRRAQKSALPVQQQGPFRNLLPRGESEGKGNAGKRRATNLPTEISTCWMRKSIRLSKMFL